MAKVERGRRQGTPAEMSDGAAPSVVRRITRAGDCRPDEAFAGDGEEIPGDGAGASPETIKQVRARRSELRCCCPDNGLGRGQERTSFEVNSSSERCGRTVANGRSSRSCWHSESGIMTVTAFRPRPSMTRMFGDLDRTCESSCCRRSRRPSRVNATTYLLCVSFAISAYFSTTMPWSHTFKKTLFVELFIASIAYLARFRVLRHAGQIESRGNGPKEGLERRIGQLVLPHVQSQRCLCTFPYLLFDPATGMKRR